MNQNQIIFKTENISFETYCVSNYAENQKRGTYFHENRSLALFKSKKI